MVEEGPFALLQRRGGSVPYSHWRYRFASFTYTYVAYWYWLIFFCRVRINIILSGLDCSIDDSTSGSNGINYALVPHVYPKANGIVSGFTGVSCLHIDLEHSKLTFFLARLPEILEASYSPSYSVTVDLTMQKRCTSSAQLSSELMLLFAGFDRYRELNDSLRARRIENPYAHRHGSNINIALFA